jgi:tubulin-folding cofactor B
MENNPELNHQTVPVIIVEDDYLKDIADEIEIGDRCEVIDTKHRGTVEYIGKIPNLEQGYYVGIRLDEPYGKHTGKFGTV